MAPPQTARKREEMVAEQARPGSMAECPSIGLSCYWVWPVATDCGQAMAPAEIDHMNGRMSATRPAGRARGSGCRLCSRWPLLRPHDYVFGQARSSRPVT